MRGASMALDLSAFRYVGGSVGTTLGATARGHKRPQGSVELVAHSPRHSRAVIMSSAHSSAGRSASDGRGSAANVAPAAFIAAEAGGWRERYTSISRDAFEARLPCSRHPEVPLRLLLVGHNPSEHAWASGVGYSNPSNRLWPLLRNSGLLPATWRAEDPLVTINNHIAGDLGIGITDVLCEPGSDAAAFKRPQMRGARKGFYARLRGHAHRAGAPPRLVAFVGKKQWKELFEPPLTKIASGPQSVLPPDWPWPHGDPRSPTVWVLTSPSGRAAVAPAERLEEYSRLARSLHAMPWPLEGDEKKLDIQSDMGEKDLGGEAGRCDAAAADNAVLPPDERDGDSDDDFDTADHRQRLRLKVE